MKKRILLFAAFACVMCLAGCGSKSEEPSLEAETATEEAGDATGMAETAQEVVFGEAVIPEETDAEKLEKKLAEFNIRIPFGSEAETLGTEDAKSYLTIQDGRITAINEEAVREYVNALSKKYDTFGISREFKRHDGSVISVTGGDFGWWMDRATTAAELCERIKNLESGDFEPVYFGTGLGFKTGGNDIGTTYVEIDLDAQHLYVYRDSSMVEESDFVSGCLMKGNGTPVGTYGITYKERDATLVGENYSSSVSYWMPFNGNVGMHDASWRNEFGGHLYYMNGSHGCINLPKSKAEKIYSIVEKGEPVVVFGSMTKEKAIANLSDEEKLVAIQKGYIPMTDEVALLLLQQQQALSGQIQDPNAAQQGGDPNAAQGGDPNAAQNSDPNAGQNGDPNAGQNGDPNAGQ